MRFHERSVRLIALATLVVGSASLAAQDNRGGTDSRRPITESDLLKFVWIADPQVSPDGSHVAFVRVVVNEEKDDYETSIWIVPSNAAEVPRPLTSGTRDTSPRWAPDGREIAFVRSAEREGRAQPGQIYLLALDGGEARAITDLARGASGPVWSPDGRRLAFSSTTRPDDPPARDDRSGAAKGRSESATPPPPKSDVRVITSAVYRSNGDGWRDLDRPSHLWVTDLPTGSEKPKARQLTSGEFSEGGPVFASDGSQISFTSTRIADPYYLPADSNLYAVPVSGGELVKVADINGTIVNMKVSPDGRSLAFVGTLNGTPERSYSQSDLFVVSIGSTPRNLTASYDYDIGGGLGGDQAAPRGGSTRSPIWSPDGASIIVVAGEQGDANLAPLFCRFMAAYIRPTATRLRTSSTGWPQRATSSSFPIREAAATTDKTSATSFSTAIPATTTKT